MKNLKLITLATSLLLAAGSINAATIQQTAQFDGVAPKRLYDIYLNSDEHSLFTLGVKGTAKIDAKEGGDFLAFQNVPVPGSYGVAGKILKLDQGVHNKDQFVIVQTWRGVHDKPTDLDSTLTLTFRKNETGTEIQLVQVNIPDELTSLVNTSWNLRYFNPLKEYLKNN